MPQPSPQLETVLYAMMRFEQRLECGSRSGFFLGDVSGVNDSSFLCVCPLHGLMLVTVPHI